MKSKSLVEDSGEHRTINIERLIRINDGDAANYAKLGKASGISFASCADKVSRYCNNFAERAKYYTLLVVPARNEPQWIAEFYGDKRI